MNASPRVSAPSTSARGVPVEYAPTVRPVSSKPFGAAYVMQPLSSSTSSLPFHTELLAKQRQRHKKDREVKRFAQDLRCQQRFLGKKKTEDYAKIRLVQRTDVRQHLHHNGKKQPAATSANVKSSSIDTGRSGYESARTEEEFQEDSDVMDAIGQQLREGKQSLQPVQSSRDQYVHGTPRPEFSPASSTTTTPRSRPQSAHQSSRSNTPRDVDQDHRKHKAGSKRSKEMISGRQVCVPLLERAQYSSTYANKNDKLQSSQSLSRIYYRQEMRRELNNRKQPEQAATAAAASAAEEEELHAQDSAHGIGSGGVTSRKHIVVYLRRLQVEDGEHTDASISTARKADHEKDENDREALTSRRHEEPATETPRTQPEGSSRGVPAQNSARNRYTPRIPHAVAEAWGAS